MVVDVHGIRKLSMESKIQPKSRETTNITTTTAAQPSSLSFRI